MKRYKLRRQHDMAWFQESPDGELCRFDDHATEVHRLNDELTALTLERDALKREVIRLTLKWTYDPHGSRAVMKPEDVIHHVDGKSYTVSENFDPDSALIDCVDAKGSRFTLWPDQVIECGAKARPKAPGAAKLCGALHPYVQRQCARSEGHSGAHESGQEVNSVWLQWD